MDTFVASLAAVAHPAIGCPALGPGELPWTACRLRDHAGVSSRPVPIPGFVVRPHGPFPARPIGSWRDEIEQTGTKTLSWPGGDAGSGGESASVRGAGAVRDTSGSRSDGAGEPCSTVDPASGTAPDTGGARAGGDAWSGMASGLARRPGEGSEAGARPHARPGSGPERPRGRRPDAPGAAAVSAAAHAGSLGEATPAGSSGPATRARAAVAYVREPGPAKEGDHA